jgi:hypothetical protein
MTNRRAGAMLMVMALGVIWSACRFADLCGEVTFSQGQSADGVYGAKAYAIDCGAVGDFNLRISLTTSSAFGPAMRRELLHVMGRFTAGFEWPESRLLRVTVTCVQAGDCTDAETEDVRKAIASSDHAWQELKIAYAIK